MSEVSPVTRQKRIIAMTTKILDPNTALEKNAARWIESRAADYEGGATKENVRAVINELLQYGCISGQVGHLIYYKDTLVFYRKHRAEIQSMINDLIDEGVLNSPADLNGWDKADPFARETNNRNLLAWFGFEEAARRLADRADLGI